MTNDTYYLFCNTVIIQLIDSPFVIIDEMTNDTYYLFCNTVIIQLIDSPMSLSRLGMTQICC
jgi:hypothetical protein